MNLFFALTVIMATITTKWWWEVTPISHEEGPTLRRISLILAVSVYLQMVLGAVVRHYQALVDRSFTAWGNFLFASLWLVMLVILHPDLRGAIGTRGPPAWRWFGRPDHSRDRRTLPDGILESEPHGPITSQEVLTVTTHLALGSILFGVSVYLATATRRLFTTEQSSQRRNLAQSWSRSHERGDRDIDSRRTRNMGSHR